MDTHHLASPYRTNEYTFRVPTPPRIMVPPPSLNANCLPDFSFSAFPDSSFLSNMPYENLVTSNALLDWSYERRREAQRILPFLYLGPMVAAKDRSFLTRESITMVVAIRQRHSFESKLMNGALKVAGDMGIMRLTVDLADNQELIAQFPAINKSINDHLAMVYQLHQAAGKKEDYPAMGKVLVFCESGNERSAGAVAAYLMEMHRDVDHVKAMQLCQAQRFCVNFDDGMKRVLQSYFDILRAKRDVGILGGAADRRLISGTSSLGSKRGLEVDGDGGDTDMQDEEDAARFERRNFAPFVDMS